MRLIALLSCLILSACATDTPNYENAKNSQFTAANYEAIDQLTRSIKIPIDKTASVLVGTVANIDRLDSSSRFGRLLGEQAATRLTNLGFNVVEMKLRNAVQVGPAGEMTLSRDAKDLSKSYNSQLVITGTYAVAKGYIYVTLKAISVTDNRVVSAYNYSMPITENTKAML